MAWFCGERDREFETVRCKYKRRSRCYSPPLEELSRGWYYADDTPSPYSSPVAETIVCYNPKDLEDKCGCNNNGNKCPCLKKKEEDDKKCPCIKKKEEDDKKCPCLKKKEEDDKKCPCEKKSEEEARKASEIVCATILPPRSCRGDGCERFTVGVYDRTYGPIYRQFGSCCNLSLSLRTRIDDILRFLAPDPYRQRVLVHWTDGNLEELDHRIPLSEIRRFAERFSIKEKKRVRFL
ncbi:hypothetical protein CP533_2457 [Ophiocordyceps camponoti-saundersi (nom. inval.)]|nr:hypothetical protein CP533_2457 [Ophiocordyceps camponoti-saundersi (nom. inval.)]